MENTIEIKLKNSLKEVCCQGLEQGVFPGVAAAVSLRSDTGWKRGVYAAGVTRLNSLANTITQATYFDLASLTKPLCTSLSLLSLLESKRLSLTDTLDCFFTLPRGTDKKQITIHHLLTHASGLPAYRPYFERFSPEVKNNRKAALVEAILGEPLEYPTGTLCRYSDLGFILLGEIIEEQAGMDLDTFYASTITGPLELSEDLLFLPESNTDSVSKKDIAATEKCSWRKAVIQGRVHDEHCWLMGGVGGHAGLFGRVEGVIQLCEHILDQYKGRSSHPAYGNDLLQQAVTRQYRGETWAMGFDSKNAEKSSSGRYFSELSFGHLGFSGTSFWVDPECELIMVLLTNRVHPDRENRKIRTFRPVFHDSIREKIGLTG